MNSFEIKKELAAMHVLIATMELSVELDNRQAWFRFGFSLGALSKKCDELFVRLNSDITYPAAGQVPGEDPAAGQVPGEDPAAGQVPGEDPAAGQVPGEDPGTY